MIDRHRPHPAALAGMHPPSMLFPARPSAYLISPPYSNPLRGSPVRAFRDQPDAGVILVIFFNGPERTPRYHDNYPAVSSPCYWCAQPHDPWLLCP
jgi:hypothetical protein